uniref:Uncharacterized protein n=1 Tax=Sciurus vulgaris TaxID=55149 RepID=A0A8D2DXF8_SCIVU
MESEKRLMENEKLWMVTASERHVMDSETEICRMNSDSQSRVHLMGEEKHDKIRSKRYMMDSDSEPCGMDSDTERYEIALATEKCLMDPKTFQLSTDSEGFWIDSWSERHIVDLNSESLGMANDSLKHIRKAKTCQSVCDLEIFWMGKSESERNMKDSEKEQSDFDHGRCWDSPRNYRHRSVKLQDISERCQDDSQKLQHDLDKHKVDSHYEKHHTNSANERHQNEFESKRHLMEIEREEFENVKRQVDEESEHHLAESDNEKKHRTTVESERHHLNSENEAERLGARRKENRPQGFWRPVFLPPPVVQGKVTKEQHSVQQQIDSKVSRIQLVKYLSDDKMVRFKEASPTLSQKQASQQNLKEKHNNISSDPNTFMDDKHERKSSHKISFYKSHCKNYRYAHNFQSSRSQFDPIHLSAEGYSSGVSAPVCSPTSISPTSVVCPKTQRNNIPSVDMGTKRCFRCFMEITNSPFHKCVMNSDDDSDPDCPLHLQIPLDSKYSISPKSVRHHETYQYSPLSQTLDHKGPVAICCPLHQEESKYSLGSTYLHRESCSAFQNLIASITHTFPINSENTIGHHSTSDPDTAINTCNVTGVESEHKFNLTAKPKNEINPDNETEVVSTGNHNNSAKAKDRPLPKDEIDHKTDTNSEDETDAEEETDPEDENNTKEKKDPKDKSDSDDKDPKGNNSEYDANNNEFDPSGDAGPTSGTDSSSDGDPNNGNNPNSENDPNIDNATNNDSGSKFNTDTEEDIHTNNSYSGSVLVDQDNTANSNNDTNPNDTSGTQNRTGLIYTSCSNNGAGPSNATKLGNDFCPNIGPGFQNIRSTTNNLGPSSNDFGPNNFHNPNNTTVPQKDPDSNYNVSPSNTTSNNNAIILNNDTEASYDTRPTSATGHNYTAAPHHDSDHDYVPEFTHAVRSTLVTNPNYIYGKSYAARPNSAASTVTFTDTSNTTSYSSVVNPRYNTGTNYDSDTNHIPRFTHFIDSTIVANTNYIAINMQNAHSANIGNNLSGPELEINSSTSVPNIIYGNYPTFAASTSYIFTPKNLTTSKFSDSSNLGRKFIIFDEQKCQTPFKVSASSMDSTTFMHGIGSKDFLDAKESCFSKYSSGVQNTIGIKDPVSLKIHYNPNIPLPSFDIIVEAEPPDVVKFAISSGAVNQFFKVKNNSGSSQETTPPWEQL